MEHLFAISEPAERTCHRCGETRPIGMFYVDLEQRRAEKDGRTRWKMHCRICQRAKMSKYLSKRREHLDRVKLEAGCADCGIRSPHPEIYDFDHVRGEKVAGVADLLTSGSWDAFIAEIEKCEVVCANCHRIRTKSRQPVHFGKTRS